MPREFASRSRRASFRKSARESVAAGDAAPVTPASESRADAATATADRPVEHVPTPALPPASQEKVLAEISHELGNFFHKLYYWSDYLQEKRAGRSHDTTATQMLARTIHNLEEFLKVSLDFFRPLSLSTMRMSVSDLVAGVTSQMPAEVAGVPVTICDDGQWDGCSVLVDPGRFPPLFMAALRRLTEHAGGSGRVQVTMSQACRGERTGLQVELMLCDTAPGAAFFQTAAAGVEWAVAERIVVLHGGEVTERADGPSQRTIALFLPYHA